MRNISLGTIAAAALLAVAAPQSTQAQGMAPKVAPCALAWCPVLVQVVKNVSGADVRVGFVRSNTAGAEVRRCNDHLAARGQPRL